MEAGLEAELLTQNGCLCVKPEINGGGAGGS